MLQIQLCHNVWHNYCHRYSTVVDWTLSVDVACGDLLRGRSNFLDKFANLLKEHSLCFVLAGIGMRLDPLCHLADRLGLNGVG